MLPIFKKKRPANLSQNAAPKEILQTPIRPELAVAELLEPRVVPAVNVGAGVASATQLSPVQITELLAGLKEMSALGESLETTGDLAKNIESIGVTFGDLFDFGSGNGKDAFLDIGFRDQLDALFKATPTATVKNVGEWLNVGDLLVGTTGDFDVNWKLLQGGEYTGSAHPLEWEVQIVGERNGQADFSLGQAGNDADISMKVAPKVDVTTKADFTFSFGLTDTNKFFATLGDLTFSLDGKHPTLGTTGTVQFKDGTKITDYELDTGSTIALQGSHGDIKITGAGSEDGEFTETELKDLASNFADTDYSIGMTDGGSVEAALRLKTTSNVPVQLKFSDDNALDTKAGDITYDVSVLDYVAGGNISGLFAQVQTFAKTLNDNPLYKINLPGVGTALNAIEGLPVVGDLLAFSKAVDTWLGAAQNISLLGLSDVLENELGTYFKDNDIAATLALSTDFDSENGFMLLNVSLDTGTLSKEFDFDRLGEAATQAGLAFGRDQNLKIGAGLRFQAAFDIGVDMNQPVGSEEAIFFNAGDVKARLDFDAKNINLDATFGPVSAKIVDGSLNGYGELAVKISGAQLDGRVTLKDLKTADKIKFEFDADGDFEADLPLDVDFEGFNIPTPKIRLTTPDIFLSLPTVDVNVPDFSKLFNIGKISPLDMLDLAISIGDWAVQFRDIELFDINIPFLDYDFGDMFDFGLYFAHSLRDVLKADLSFVPTLGSTSNFQALQLPTDLTFGIASGTNAPTMLTIPAGDYATKDEYITALNTALGTSSPYIAEAHGDGGVRIKAKNSNATPAFALVGPTRDLKTLRFVDSNTVVDSSVTLPLHTPEDGKLSDDANILVSVDGATPVPITIAKSATTANTTRADLAADITAALTAQNITASVSGNKITLTHNGGASFAILAGSGHFRGIGLEDMSSGGVTTITNSVRSGQAYETLTDMVPLLLKELGLDDGDTDPSNDPIRARYDINTETFYLHFEREFDLPEIEVPVGFNFELDNWASLRSVDTDGLPADAKLKFTPRVGGKFEFGISLAGDDAFQEISLLPATGFAPNGYEEKADGSPDSSKAKAWDGKLDGDATFLISLDDAKEYSITISKASTAGNTKAADLLKQFSDALDAVPQIKDLVDVRLIPANGGTAERLEFFTLEQTGDFQTQNLRIKSTGADKVGFDADQFTLSEAPTLNVASQVPKNIDFSPDHDDGLKFTISLDGSAPKQFSVTKDAMKENTDLAALLSDINDAITADADLNGKVQAVRYGLSNQIQFLAADGTRQMTFTADSQAAQQNLKFGTEKFTTRSRGGTFFINDAEINASGTVTLEDFNVAAQLGFINLTALGISGDVTIGATINLAEDGGNTRFEFGELFSRLANGSIGDIVQVDFSGEAHASLSTITLDAEGLSLTSDALIKLDAPDIFATGGPDFTVTFDGFDPTKLLNFSKLSWREIYEGIKLGVEFLSKTEQFDFLKDTKIPLINLSVTDVFTYTDKVVAAIDQIEADPGGALDAVEAKIEELLGIPDEAFDLSLEGESTVKIHLGYSTTYSSSYGLDFDLKEIAKLTGDAIPEDLLSLGGFLDASANGSLQFAAYAGLSLDIGLDFSGSATDPGLIVYKTSGVDLGLRLIGEQLNISATLGPAGFEISNGVVVFDSDGVLDANDDDLPDGDFAIMHFGPLEDITDVSGTVDAIKGGAKLTDYFGPSFTGKIVATLPGAITSDIGSFDLPGPIVVTVEDVSDLFSSDAKIRANSVKLTLPEMSELLPEVPGLIQLLRDPAILLDGVDNGLSLVQKLITGKAATNLPLIGTQLRQGANFIEQFRAGFLADLTTKLRGAGDTLLDTLQQSMFDLFADEADGATGKALGLLKDYNGDGSITKDDVVLSFRDVDGNIIDGNDRDADAVMFNLHIGQEIKFGTDLNLEWGLPGLDLDINGSPELKASWDFYFGFGVSISDYFFLDAAPPESFSGSGATMTMGDSVEHELALTLEARLTPDGAQPFTAQGRLFFIQLDATDKEVNGEYSRLSGTIFVDLTDPGTASNQDGRVTVRELFSRSPKAISAGLEAEAKINIGLVGSVQGSAVIPRILADFSMDWNYVLGQPLQTPDVGFTNVKLDLGSFLSDFLQPIVKRVNDIIKPFDPVIDALQTRIPVLSDIMGRNYTVLDLAVQFGKVDRRFVDAVLQVRELIADIAAVPAGEPILIDLGEMVGLGNALSTKDGAKNVNTSSAGTSQVDYGSSQAGSTLTKSTKITGGGFAFPILKPANAFKLLLGQEATLVTYDIPRLEVGMSMSKTFPIWGPLVGKFSGSITAFADFAVGFDTKGFNTYRTSGDVVDILDGFFISDRANPDGTGADVPEAGFKGRIGIGGAINAAIVEAGIEGFFELTANLDMNDPNDDGKIRGSEILALLNHRNGYGPLNLGSIRLIGEVGARAYVDFWAPFDWYNAWEWEFARIRLFDKTFSAPKIAPELAQVATVGAESTVTLNAGPTAKSRDFISTSDVGEEFIVTGTGKNITVTFTNTGHKQDFSGVDRIVLNGGKGNDRLIIGKDVTTAITFNGGEGDDYFEGGAGDDIVIGGTGNDTIIGNGGNNTLDGGEGADTLTGGDGNDILIGGLGDDLLDGGGGDDTYEFANDWGNDAFENDQTGTGKFDFSKVTTDVTLSISSGGSQGSSGSNFIAYSDSGAGAGISGLAPAGTSYITNIIGGTGNDVFNVAATSDTTVTVDGSGGSDQYIVNFGRLSSAIEINDTGTGPIDVDTVSVTPGQSGYTIDVFDNSVTGTKTGVTLQAANFTNAIENLTVDAKANGGLIRIAEAISFTGDVRLLAKQAEIENTVDAGSIRLESTTAVLVGANVNAHDNGDVTILVNGGNITIEEDILSSAGAGFTGDGAGLVHLYTAGGAIVTGSGNGGPGRVLAAEGALLLRGTNGSIGSAATPIYSTVSLLSASTTGSGLINLHESDGLTIGVIGNFEGIKTTGGTFNIFNDDNELLVAAPITAEGADGTLTSDELQINADIISPGGDIFLRPEGDQTIMALGEGVAGEFQLNQSEIDHLINGFTSIQIGFDLGRNLVNIGDVSFQDVILIQNPILGGHVDQTGTVTVTDGASFTILGSGHTTSLSNQNVATNIDIIDSAIVPEGGNVTLTSTGGSININFDLDGTAGGADETLILSAANDVVIKGAIGSVAQLGTLQITGATNIRFEGSVNVKNLILDDGVTFTVDGTITADTIQLNGVNSVTFHSGMTLATSLTTSGSFLNTVIFEGQVNAPTVDVTATDLVDFYQLVNVTSGLTVTVTDGITATGDIVFRQQVNANASDITLLADDDITFIGPVSGDDLVITDADVFSMQANTTLTGGLTQSAGSGITTLAQLTADSLDVTSAGLILGGITTLTGTPGLVVNIGTGVFNAAGSVTANNGPLTINARSISFQNTVSARSAALTAEENITVANASSFSLGTSLNATTSSATIGEIKFTGPTSIGADATLSTPRALTFQNTLGVTGNLTVSSANSAQYQGAVNIGGTFQQTAGVTGATTFNSTVNSGVLDLRSSSIAFSGDVTTTDAVRLTTNAGGVSATANLTAAGDININASTTIALLGATTAYTASFTAAQTITIGVGGISTSASPTNGDVTLTTTAAVAGNSVTVNGTVNTKGAFNITAARGVLATSTINADSTDIGGSALTFNSLVTTAAAARFSSTGLINLAAGLNAGGTFTIPTASAITLGDSVTAASASLTAANTINISVGGMTSTTGNIALTTTAAGAGNAISSLGLVDAAGALTLTSPRGVALNLVDADSFTVDAASISLPAAVTTAGDISLTAATTGNITSGSTITAGGSLIIPRGKAITFGGLVSANSVAIGLDAESSIETVSVGVGGIAATTELYIRTTVAGTGNGITTQGTLTAGNSSTLTLASVRGVDVSGSLSTGDLLVDGTTITLRSVVNAADDVTLSSTGAVNVNADMIALGDVTVLSATALNFGAQLQAANLIVSGTQSAVFAGKTTIGTDATITLTGDMSTSAEFSTGGALAIPSVRDLSFGGFVSAASVNIGSTTARSVTIGTAGLTTTDNTTIATNVAGTGNGIITNGAVTTGNAATLSLTSVRGVEVNAALSTGDLIINGAAITVRGVTNAADDVTLSSPGTISIQSDLTATDDVTVSQAGALNFGAKLTATDLIVTNTANATFIGQVALSDTASLDLTGDLTTSAQFAATTSITVSNVRDVSFGGLVSSATVSIGTNSARTITVNAAGVATTGALTLRSTDATGALNLNGPLTSADAAVTLSALGAITSTATITGDTITATAPAMSLGGALVADGAGTSGVITLDSIVANAGNIIVGGVVSSTGSLLIGATTWPQAVALNGALNIGQDLIVQVSETLTTGAQIAVTRDISFTTISNTAGETRINGSLTAGRDFLLTTPRNATFIAPVTIGGNATVASAAALQFDGALNVTGSLTQTLGTVSSRFASISAASLDVNSRTIAVTNAVTATSGNANFTADTAGKVSIGGNTNVAGSLTVPTADEVILTGNVTAADVTIGLNNVRTMSFGTNLTTTTGNVNLIANNGPVTVAGTLTTPTALNIPSGTVISLNSAVTAAQANIGGGTLVTGSDVTITGGNLQVTTTGDVTIGGKATVSGDIIVIGSEDVSIAGAASSLNFTLVASSYLSGGAFSTTFGNALFTTTGNIRVVGLTSIASSLVITTSLNTTFQGQVAVTNALLQQDGGGATRFEGVTSADNIDVRTAQQIFAGSILRANGGDLRLEADEIDFFGGTNAVQGTANLILRPYNAATSIDVGSPTPTGLLDLSDVDINAIQDGFAQITIGRTEDGTGAMLIGSSSFRDNVAFHAGSIVVEDNPLVGQVVISAESIEMTARTGSITTNDDIFATDANFRASDDITINRKLEVADFVIFNAGTDGGGNIFHNGTMTTTSPTGTVDLTAGEFGGDIIITGTISTFDAEIISESGEIFQPSGNTKASELYALAEDGITLLTTADHINARVTYNGDINITDTNPDPAHILTLGSKTDINDGIFTNDGDITISTNRNMDALRVNANGAVSLTAGGTLNFEQVEGAPATVTATTINLDKSPATDGQDITFDGNVVLFRDVSFDSNGGNVLITGDINSRPGNLFDLFFNTAGGNATIGGAIGWQTPVNFLQVDNAGTFTLGGGAQVIADIEINANAIVITAPRGSIITTSGEQLRLYPNSTSVPIDLGAPAGGTAAFSLNDAELAAFGDGFSLIQIGKANSTHDFTIESARFLDDLELNANSVTLLKSSIAQGVNGLSVVNGQDDNDITINARTAFTQGTRAGLVAGRNGNIVITADQISLDQKNRGLIRGFGELLLQPFTASQPITLGGAGAPGGYDLTANEIGALGDTFSRVTIGRADGTHAIAITDSLNLRDTFLIRTPLDGGSITIGSGTAPTTIQAIGRSDSLRFESAGDITLNSNVKTVGRGSIELLADFDEDGAGDLLIGQALSTTNKTLAVSSEQGAIRMQGENLSLGVEFPITDKTKKGVGGVKLSSLTGDLTLRTNLDEDTDGGFTQRNLLSSINTGGIARILGGAAAGAADVVGGSIIGKGGLEIRGFESFTATGTKLQGDKSVLIEAVSATIKAKTAISSLAEIMVTGATVGGSVTVEKGASLTAKTLIKLSADTVLRDPGAKLKAKTITIEEL